MSSATPASAAHRSPDTRAAILDAALAELAAGPEPVRMEAIAERAGVSRATLYYHFHGRDALIGALIARSLDELRADAQQAAATGDPLAVVDAVLRFYCAQYARCRFLFAHLLSAPEQVEPAMQRQQRDVVAPLRACLIEAGVDGDPDLVAEALLGQVNGVVFGRLLRDEPLDSERLSPTLRTLASRVLAP